MSHRGAPIWRHVICIVSETVLGGGDIASSFSPNSVIWPFGQITSLARRLSLFFVCKEMIGGRTRTRTLDPLIKRQMVMLAVFLFRSIQFFSGETFDLSVASRFTSTSPMPRRDGQLRCDVLEKFPAEPSRHEAGIVEHDLQLVFGEGGRDHGNSTPRDAVGSMLLDGV